MTIKLSSDISARLERMAARRGLTKSAVMREALADKLRFAADEPSVYDLMRASAGTIDSGFPDLGHNPKYLKEFGRK